ncbi:MAG: hypothetical protein EOO27_30780 [Comamonadaceae bacterium]|nr:MAG: hypothetical protein EOO27_30780 [Comamonadaceae bacterium]
MSGDKKTVLAEPNTAIMTEKAAKKFFGKDENILKLRSVAEAWNLADSEAWKFIKAYRARANFERQTFEKEEAKYGGTKARGPSRWWGS